jgi:Uma2 family endonuclease
MTARPQTKYWTYEDLFDLPDDGRRYEIIEGVLYELPSPNMEHGELISNLILRVLWPFVEPLGGRVYTVPIDVFLRGANPVQPDVFVLLLEQFGYKSKRGVEGPPALIAEVLSPSNPEHDQVTKHRLYARAGVPEYWLVSPATGTVEVLALEGDCYRTHARVTGDELLTLLVLPTLSCPASVVFAA